MSKLLWHNQPVIADESLARRLDPLLAIGRERYIRRARVPPVQRPLGLAMADDEDAWGSHGR